MYKSHVFYGKKLLPLLILLILALNPYVLNVKADSNREDATIYMEPAFTDTTLTPGANFTISIETDYNGTDIVNWQFTLNYNPYVLHLGVNKTDTWIGDNATTQFYTTQKPVVPGSEEVYVDETLMTKPENYTINYDTGKINLKLTATDTWIGDNATTQFYTTQKPVVPGSEEVYVDETLMTKPENYTINNSTGEITFTTPPSSGVEIEAIYQYPPSFGVEIKAIYVYGVVNGDLITKDKHSSATFISGAFNNTEGKLALTSAFFFDQDPLNGVDVTSGPGTLANVTFTVVGYGKTNVTFGRGVEETFLQGWNETKPPPNAEGHGYFIVDAQTTPDRVIDGVFINVQPTHDVAVVGLAAPSEVIVEHVADINVTVVNEGNYTENGNVTLYYNTTEIEIKPFTLDRGEFKTVSFSWNTSGVAEGNYTLNATATIPVDTDSTDNTNTMSIELKLAPDVAVKDVTVPSPAAIGEFIPINVTVANEGSFHESVVNVTILYDNMYINSTVISLSVGESGIVEFSWNTSGVALGSHTLNATATIPVDADLSDNWKTTPIELKLGYDVAVMNLLVPHKVVAGENASITVVVENKGVYNVTDFNVTVTYDMGLIGTQLVPLLASEEQGYISFSWNTTDIDPGSYNITAEATLATDEDPTNNQNPTPKAINIIVPPVASFTFSPDDPIVDETVTFNASASLDPDGTIASYAWDFGDNTTQVYVKDENLTATTTHIYTAAGTYTVTLNVTDKDDLTDIFTTNVTVILHDIAITNVTASPSTVKIGELISINVTVVNEGTESETFTVTVYYNNTVIGAQTITELASGASRLLTFSWDTSNMSAGTYTLKALATPVADETDTNDNTVTDVIVTIEAVASLDVLTYVAVAAGVTAIIIAAVAIYLLKIKKPT